MEFFLEGFASSFACLERASPHPLGDESPKPPLTFTLYIPSKGDRGLLPEHLSLQRKGKEPLQTIKSGLLQPSQQ